MGRKKEMVMRAAVFDKPGIENLKVRDNVEKPTLAKPDDVLIKVKVAGVNPIDNVVVSGSISTVSPIPHIPGAEVSGTVDDIGSEVNGLKKLDRVVIHNKVFDVGAPSVCLTLYFYYAVINKGSEGSERKTSELRLNQ